MSLLGKVLFLSDPEDDWEIEPAMKFRLTYEGELRATQGEARANQTEPMAMHKHRIRRVFHKQLKTLWKTEPFLSTHTVSRADIRSRPAADEAAIWGGDDKDLKPWDLAIAELYRENGYRFVPLVREDVQLLCSLDILFLRRDSPGSLLHAGDIDNRIKTVIDALRRPRNANELAGNEAPQDGEDPFYCLLEDDKNVSHLSVETDRLLDPPSLGNADASMAKLIITVAIKPYYNTLLNLMFA